MTAKQTHPILTCERDKPVDECNLRELMEVHIEENWSEDEVVATVVLKLTNRKRVSKYEMLHRDSNPLHVMTGLAIREMEHVITQAAMRTMRGEYENVISKG